MLRTILNSICGLAFFLATLPVFGTTPLTLKPLSVQPNAASHERLFNANPVVPRCNETGEVVQLAIEASIFKGPAARITASLELSLGPTVGRGGHHINLLQKVRGTLITGSDDQQQTWQVVDMSGGPFSPRIVTNKNRVVFLLPSKLQSRQPGVAPVYALLGIRCLASDGAINCTEALFLFEDAYPKIFAADSGLDRLFHPQLREAVRNAALEFAKERESARRQAEADVSTQSTAQSDQRPSKVRANPFLDCCIGWLHCACQPCDPADAAYQPCATVCETCLFDDCFDCHFAECMPC